MIITLRVFISLLSVWLFSIQLTRAQVDLFWGGSKFIKAGIIDFIVTSTSFTTKTGNVTYDTAMVNTTSIRNVAIGITKLDYSFANDLISYWVRDSLNDEFGFQFQVNSSNSLLIKALSFAYITADYVIPENCMNMGMFWVDKIVYESSTTLVEQVNYTDLSGQSFVSGHQFCIQAYNNYLVASASSSSNFILNTTVTLINTQIYQVSVKIPSNMGIKKWGFMRLVVDKTNLEALNAFNFSCGLWNITNGSPSSLSIDYAGVSNLMIGLFSFSSIGQTNLDFEISLSPLSNITTMNYDTAPVVVSFMYFALTQFQCPQTQPYAKIQTNNSELCYTNCGTGYFENQSNVFKWTCDPCSNACLQCTSSTTCTMCETSFHLQNIVGTIICVQCNTSIPGCLYCNSTPSCSQCQPTFYLNSAFMCISCQSYDVKCISCTDTLCSECEPGYQVAANDTTKCEIVILCIVENCANCMANSVNMCENCNLGYHVNSQGSCQTSCGDGLCIISDQECDDGNFDNMDGCSLQCKIQNGFVCDLPLAPANPLSDCTFTRQIQFNINFLEKIQGSNQVKAQTSIRPLLKAFQTFDFRSLVSTDLPIQNYSFDYDKETGILIMYLTYQNSIQDLQATVTINPPKLGIFRLTPPSSTKIVMRSRDNEALNVYNDQHYGLAENIQIIAVSLLGVAWLFFFLGLFSGKLVAVQMLSVFQISFLGLITVKNQNPTLYALKNLYDANGFNSIMDNHYTLESMPKQIEGMGLSYQFISNFNINLALIFVPLLLALLSLILNKTVFKQDKQKSELMDKICIASAGEYTFLIIMISAYLISASVTLQCIYGFSQVQQVTEYASIAGSVIALITFVVYFVLLFVKPGIFGEFKNQFDPSSKVSYMTYNYFMVQRTLIGIGLVAAYFIPYILLLPVIIFLVQGFFFAIRRPYNKARHSYRMVVNNLISISILSIYMYFSLSSQSSTSEIGIYLPILVLALLTICLIMNAIFIIRSFVKCIRKKCEQNKQQKAEFIQLSHLKTLKMDCIQTVQNSPCNLHKLRDQHKQSMLPQVQKLQHKQSKDELKLVQMSFDDADFRQQKCEDVLNINLQQHQQKVKNAIETLKQNNKKNKIDVRLAQQESKSRMTNLLQYDDL